MIQYCANYCHWIAFHQYLSPLPLTSGGPKIQNEVFGWGRGRLVKPKSKVYFILIRSSIWFKLCQFQSIKNWMYFNIQVNLNTGFINSPDKEITIKFTPRWLQTTFDIRVVKLIIPQNKVICLLHKSRQGPRLSFWCWDKCRDPLSRKSKALKSHDSRLAIRESIRGRQCYLHKISAYNKYMTYKSFDNIRSTSSWLNMCTNNSLNPITNLVLYIPWIYHQ